MGYVIEDKSLNLINLSLSTHKMGIVTHSKRFIVITEITHATYLPEGLAPREHSISGTSYNDGPCSEPTLGDLTLPVLTFCLVLRGCAFNFSSLLLEILRNCLRSP